MEIEELRELQNKLQKEVNQLVNKIIKLQDVLFALGRFNINIKGD